MDARKSIGADKPMKYITFFENWHELAEGRDTDEKRLAFYDAIFRYAFGGIVPPKPVKGASHGPEWAAWDAYNAVRPVVDKKLNRIAAGRMGGAPLGNKNACKKQPKQGSETRCETSVPLLSEDKDKDKENKTEEESSSARDEERVVAVEDGNPNFTIEQLRRTARAKGIPVDFAEEIYDGWKRVGFTYERRGTQTSTTEKITARNAGRILGSIYNYRRDKDRNGGANGDATAERREKAKFDKVEALANRLVAERGDAK